MNNEELLHALGNLLLNKNKSISLDLAYENYINQAKVKCRKETVIYYEKKWAVLKPILKDLNFHYTSDLTKTNYNTIINILISKNYCNATINKYCDLLKSILKINVELDYIPYSPLANIKKLKETIPEVKTITQENIEKIFNYMFNQPKTFLNVRDTLGILIMNDTGVRANELVNIKVKNINIQKNTIYLDFTKTHEPRYVFIQDKTIEWLNMYLKFHNGNEYLFLTLEGKQLQRDSMYHKLEKIKKELKISQSITPHKWRHTFATNLIKNNVNLNTIMKVMGHTQYSTTQRYLHQETDELKNQVLEVLNKS